MARYRISPPGKDCMSMGVDLGGGVVKDYPVQSDGYVHVDNPNHAKALTREVGTMAMNIPSGLVKGSGWSCPKCAFEAWDFSKKCPRCSTAKPKASK